MFQFLTHVELSRSMAAILEMPQYVVYQKNAVYVFIKLSAKFHSFNTMDGLSCPTKLLFLYIIKTFNSLHRVVKKTTFSHATCASFRIHFCSFCSSISIFITWSKNGRFKGTSITTISYKIDNRVNRCIQQDRHRSNVSKNFYVNV